MTLGFDLYKKMDKEREVATVTTDVEGSLPGL